MKKLYVFSGKPGCGKSTLLNEMGVKYYDVLPYIKKYLDKDYSLLSEDFTIKAYSELFSDLSKTNDNKIFLEIGTNHPEFVFKKIKELNLKAAIFLCILDKKTCLERCNSRKRRIATEQLIRRMNKPFPEIHLQFITKYDLDFHYLDMNNSIKINSEYVKMAI